MDSQDTKRDKHVIFHNQDTGNYGTSFLTVKTEMEFSFTDNQDMNSG